MTRPALISTSTRDATAPPARKNLRRSDPVTSTTGWGPQVRTERRARAVQAALPCPAAHEAAVFTVRQAFTGLRLQVDALKAALGIRTMARSETFDPARHRVMATRPATDAAQERRVAAVLRDGSEMERGERCVVVEPALVEVFRLEDSHEQ